MRDFCPLCKTKITAIQINFEEAVWMCINEKCYWPFGYEDPVIFYRNAHTYFDDDQNKDHSQSKELMSMELALYTPPVTPGRESIDSSAVVTLEERSSDISLTNDVTALKRELLDSGNLTSFKPLCVQSHRHIEDNITTEDKITRDAGANVSTTLPKIMSIQQINIDLRTALQNLSKVDQKIKETTKEQRRLLVCTSSAKEITKTLNCTTNKDSDENAQLGTIHEMSSWTNVGDSAENCSRTDLSEQRTTSLESDQVPTNSCAFGDTVTDNSDYTNLETILDQVMINESVGELTDDWLDLLLN